MSFILCLLCLFFNYESLCTVPKPVWCPVVYAEPKSVKTVICLILQKESLSFPFPHLFILFPWSELMPPPLQVGVGTAWCSFWLVTSSVLKPESSCFCHLLWRTSCPLSPTQKWWRLPKHLTGRTTPQHNNVFHLLLCLFVVFVCEDRPIFTLLKFYSYIQWPFPSLFINTCHRQQGWEGYFGNVIGDRLLVILLKMRYVM